jgi:two-component sensor histidine kinase
MTKTAEVAQGVPVCAIGASAGDVPALRAFFRHLPDDLGLAYVVHVHLAPDQPSALCEILRAVTRMEVLQVCDSPELRPNCIYVIAPDREPVIDANTVAARPVSDPRQQHAPIDMFFRSVATARGDGIAVILSGDGADGAMGIRAINEAYRSAPEELEPSKAELQSMNEELRRVNAALQSKLESIASAHSDLKNIVAATDIATLFLDHKLRIRMFTPRLANLFNITEVDIGRTITDLSHRLKEDGIAADVEQVLRDLAPVEREVATRDGRWLVMRVRPYRTMDDRIEGAVVTFVDVTTQRVTSERLRHSDEQKSFLLQMSDTSRALQDVAAIRTKASEMIAVQLGADCVCSVEFDAAAAVARLQGGYVREGKNAGAAPLAGLRDLAEFSWTAEAFEKGEGLIVPDMVALPHVPGAEHAPLADFGLRACMAVPLIKNGRAVGALMVGHAEQRDWTLCDLEFLRTVSERLWLLIDGVATETALRDSEERFRALIQASSDVLYRMTPDWSQMLELRSDGFLTETSSADGAWSDRYILPADKPRVWAHIAEVIRRKVPFELEHRVQQADGTVGWTFSRAIPIFDAQGEITEWFGAAGDITDRRRSEERLRETRDALRLATEASQLGWGAWDFASGQADWDLRARQIIGLAEDENTIESWMARVHPADRARITAEIAASLRDQRPFDLEYRVIHPDMSERAVHGTGYFQAPTHGGAARGTGLVRDVTEFRRWEESQRLLIGELNHRVKNMLAVIQSIARQTQRTTTGVDAFIEAFGNRVQALAAAHDILTQRRWSGAGLGQIVHAAMASFAVEGGQIEISGPEIRLGPDATISFAMAFHELATNALKHGALSVPEGQVKIFWNINAAGRVVVRWTESGGPKVEPPTRKGFGSRLLEQGIARELDGVAEADYCAEGFCWKMEFSVDATL